MFRDTLGGAHPPQPSGRRPRSRAGRGLTNAAALATCLVAAGCAIEVDGSGRAASGARDVQPNPVPTVVVLDASDSMNTDDAPGPRLAAARAAVTSLATGLPDGTPFGVVAFGSQMPAASTPQATGCADVTTLVPLGPLDREGVDRALAGLKAQGFTPISAALEKAAAQLSPDEPASIVLVSDGESTCEPPPCDTAEAIHRSHPDVTISAVGFRTDDPSLVCVAEKGGGLFVTADNAAQLSSRLAAAQNAEAARSRLSPTGRAGIDIGATLADIRATNPSFPASGRAEGRVTIYRWLDCDYGFDGDVLVSISPGDPPGSAGTTIDGVSRGTPGSRAVELYGEPLEDSDGVAVFTADEASGTAYRIGYEGADAIAKGTVTTVILCRCLPSKTSDTSDGPELVEVVAVDGSGRPINGFSVGSTRGSFHDVGYCTHAIGALTTGVYHCGATVDSASACWPSGSQLLCTHSPWVTELRSYSYSGRLPTLSAPDPESRPWGLELEDGSRCAAILGGAFSPQPQGFLYSYGCKRSSGSDLIVYQDPESEELFDKSGSGWTVWAGPPAATATPTKVTKIYRPAAQ
ncbi:vWA domain-containing protein [Gordonia paraffinivorans]|uniref:vWA domain-containing protein n=1 Tax=Gordonia paraffinivorans TaxID=175628 RepID=UPI00144829FB|nr:VWA domain-containing protein [Gordonia paraffinivorans]MCD2147121.1 VWA domain-containing protein [Gordonia paraffinivorans]